MSVMGLSSVVTYDGLPASSGGAHALRVKKPAAAWSSVGKFVDACLVPLSDRVTLRLWAGGPADATQHVMDVASSALGGPSRRDHARTDWNVRPEALETVLSALTEIGAAGVTAHGHSLAALVRTVEGGLIDPRTGTTYANIAPEAFGDFAVDGYGRRLGRSGIRASVGTAGSSLSLWVNLPDTDEELARAAGHLQAHLPFRLSTKHWRRWQQTRNGQSYRSAKIASPLAR